MIKLPGLTAKTVCTVLGAAAAVFRGVVCASVAARARGQRHHSQLDYVIHIYPHVCVCACVCACKCWWCFNISICRCYRTAKSDRQLTKQANIGGVAAATPRDPLRRSSQGAPVQALKAAPTTRCSVGKRVALATEAHLSNLPMLIASETHFAQGLATFISSPFQLLSDGF